MDEKKFARQLEQLQNVMDDEDYNIRSLLQEIVPTYNYSSISQKYNSDSTEISVETTAFYRKAINKATIASIP